MKKTGIELIAAERQRQIEVEGYKVDSDKESYGNGQLMGAAGCYLANALSKAYFDKGTVDPFARFQVRDTTDTRLGKRVPSANFIDAWPWDSSYDKRYKHDLERSLVIAGALIAAQLDLLNQESE